MMVEDWLEAFLTADAAVNGIIGGRIYAPVAPQHAETPFLAYQRISAPRMRSMRGPSGIAHPRLQIDAWAETYGQARALAAAVRRALDGFRGRAADGTRIRAAALVDDRDFYDEEVKLPRVSADYLIWHDETG